MSDHNNTIPWNGCVYGKDDVPIEAGDEVILQSGSCKGYLARVESIEPVAYRGSRGIYLRAKVHPFRSEKGLPSDDQSRNTDPRNLIFYRRP